MTDDIAAFILARYDEREQAARAALPGPWSWVDPGGRVKQALVSGPWSPATGWSLVLPSATGDIYPSAADAEFIALNDPAYVLADIAAKRRIVELLFDLRGDPVSGMRVADGLCELALPFAGHPDYLESWRP